MVFDSDALALTFTCSRTIEKFIHVSVPKDLNFFYRGVIDETEHIAETSILHWKHCSNKIIAIAFTRGEEILHSGIGGRGRRCILAGYP